MTNYKHKICWKTTSSKTISFGKIIQQKIKDQWLLVQVIWETNETTWEKVANLSFDLNFELKIKRAQKNETI